MGSIFTFGLIAVCFMQAVMMEKVFYGIPHKMGYFKVKEIFANAAKTTPRDSARASGKVEGEGDDDFTKINEA